MTTREFAERVLMNLPYVPNDQQVQLIGALARFCSRSTPSDSVFLLNGYAGTGKTSLTGALVKTLREVGITTILLAPTGRAAKVFAAYSRHPAYTIHRMIYRAPTLGSTSSTIAMTENRYHNAIFVVDEASMIGTSSDSGDNLLEDLIHYVYSGDNCRMILLGDTAQLPPVGCTESPAMSVKMLRSYGLRVTRAVLTETARQTDSSGILYNATLLRRAMRVDPLPSPLLYASPFSDIEAIASDDLEESLSSAYNRDGIGETILITRSNKRASQFNMAIRSTILCREEVLSSDERLLVAKNNYFWSATVKGLDFIANGDVATINKVYGTEVKYDETFADVSLHLSDRDIDVDCKIFITSLASDSPGMPTDRLATLYQRIINDPDEFAPDTPMTTRLKHLKKSPYYNALQVKYAYAVTCHKAQGGQWRNVYIDMSYIPPEAQGLDFFRWLYTATTRATSRLYLINPSVTIK